MRKEAEIRVAKWRQQVVQESAQKTPLHVYSPFDYSVIHFISLKQE